MGRRMKAHDVRRCRLVSLQPSETRHQTRARDDDGVDRPAWAAGYPLSHLAHRRYEWERVDGRDECCHVAGGRTPGGIVYVAPPCCIQRTHPGGRPDAL